MSRLAVVCAAGIGDALIFQIAAHHLAQAGHDITTFSNSLSGFGKWLSLVSTAPQPLLSEIETTFADYDAILVQHDNTPKSRQILSLRPKKIVYTFYTNYRETKHGPLFSGFDFPFDENRPMVENVVQGLSALFGIRADPFQNGLTAPRELCYQKYPRRIAIHPVSTIPDKNWPRNKFLKVARWLEQNDYEPVFIAPPEERSDWKSPLFPTLADLADFLYESGGFLGNDSGPGHLASLFGLPYLIIGRQERQMRLWRPGWHSGQVVLPPSWLPNLKGLRLRDEKWKLFITTRNVINQLKRRVLKIN